MRPESTPVHYLLLIGTEYLRIFYFPDLLPANAILLMVVLMLHIGYNEATIDLLSELSPYGVRVWDNQNRKQVIYLKYQISSTRFLMIFR